MTDTEKPEKLAQISRLLDQLAEELPPETAWAFAAVAKLNDSKGATMFCTNQETNEQALRVIETAFESQYLPDSVSEKRLRETRQ